jgi:hypothetical protein
MTWLIYHPDCCWEIFQIGSADWISNRAAHDQTAQVCKLLNLVCTGHTGGFSCRQQAKGLNYFRIIMVLLGVSGCKCCPWCWTSQLSGGISRSRGSNCGHSRTSCKIYSVYAHCVTWLFLFVIYKLSFFNTDFLLFLSCMPPNEQKYFKKIKHEKNVKRFWLRLKRYSRSM